uniref:Uncharacterized protein n=1 Tax=Pararge aegeria TaxID=116150 RepID=S4P7R2_9NEOP
MNNGNTISTCDATSWSHFKNQMFILDLAALGFCTLLTYRCVAITQLRLSIIDGIKYINTPHTYTYKMEYFVRNTNTHKRLKARICRLDVSETSPDVSKNFCI